MRNRLLSAGVAIAAALAVTGCSSGQADGSPEGPKIVTTTTQVTDFTRIVAGSEALVTPLLAAGQSAHHFEADASQLSALAQADALVVSGAGLEGWLEGTIQASGFDGTIIDASTGVELGGQDDGHHHDHGEEGHEHDHGYAGEEGHEHHDHGHAGEGGHEHEQDAGGNPHIWTSPENARTMVQNIAQGVSGLPGVDAATVTANAEAYDAKLQELDAWIGENVEQVPAERRLLVTNHDSLYYYNKAYGITFIGSIIPSWDDNAEPSAADLEQLKQDIRASGASAIFTETQLSPQAAEAIARDTGAKVYTGADALYTDSLGPEGSSGAHYLGATVHNTRQLLDSWGAKASEPPAGLAA
ncbi:MAG: metal ABC transporter substrate-binding protein [Pseudoclavibacter sp.]|nr:metal ABC transporter substrate-binding protein [Pseudoclavibacter sp.]